MSRMLIAPNEITLNAVERKIDAKLRRTVKQECSFGNIVVLGKTNIGTNNIWRASNKEYAIGVGTFCYRGLLDSRALEQIYLDFDGNIREMQKDVIGSYTLLICKYGVTYIITDRNASYDFYYNIKQGALTASNSYFFLGLMLDSPVPDEYGMVQQFFQSNILAKRSVITSVSRLDGNTALRFCNNVWSEIDLPKSDFGIDMGESFWRRALNRLSPALSLFSSPAVAMTGGQDSRFALAFLLASHQSPSLIYWTGNSILTNTKRADRECVETIAQAASLPILDWDASDGGSTPLESALYTYGEHSMLYGFNEHLLTSFYNCSCDFICFGYFGEIYRNIEEISNYKKDPFTIEDYFDDLYLRGNYKEIYNNYPSYRSTLLSEMKKMCRDLGVDPDCISRDDFQHLNTELYRKRADVQMNNLTNQFCYSFPILGDPFLTDSMNRIGFIERKGSTIMISAVDELASVLLEVPFFSHIRKMAFDRSSMSLSEGNKMKVKIKQYLQGRKKSAWYYSLARKIYHVSNGDRKSLVELSGEEEKRSVLLNELRQSRVFNMLDLDNLHAMQLDSNALLTAKLNDLLWKEMVR